MELLWRASVYSCYRQKFLSLNLWNKKSSCWIKRKWFLLSLQSDGEGTCDVYLSPLHRHQHSSYIPPEWEGLGSVQKVFVMFGFGRCAWKPLFWTTFSGWHGSLSEPSLVDKDVLWIGYTLLKTRTPCFSCLIWIISTFLCKSSPH